MSAKKTGRVHSRGRPREPGAKRGGTDIPVSGDVARVSARGADRWKKRQHPWIYRSDIMSLPDLPAGGVRVIGPRDEELGMALWSPTSQIALRMVTTSPQNLDGAFWHDKIAAAWRYRQALSPDSNAFRVVHGEGDGIPSLVADWYDGHLVIQLLSAGLEKYRTDVVDALRDVTSAKGILARNDVAVRDHERLEQNVELLHGSVPEEIQVIENGIRYLAAPWTGQKTGAFLDQRENRRRVSELSHGRALDCFSYHGSFALHLAANADHVTSIDASADALARARDNVALNKETIPSDRIEFVEANAFEFLRAEEAAGAQYDMIVLDPPAFAKRRDALDKAFRGYKEINLRAMKLLAPGGYLATFTCSFHMHREMFREMLEEAASDAGRTMRWVETRSQALDHPEIVQIPESAYLKGAILQAL